VPQKKKLIGKVRFLNQLQGGEARSHMIVRARISSSPSISRLSCRQTRPLAHRSTAPR
jgi:hypothetical protein